MSERFELVRSYKIVVAHRLPWHKGKCANLHGHTIQIDIHITSDKLNENGVVMDFHDIDKHVKPLIDLLDHSYLNYWLENPTVENLAKFIWDVLEDALPLTKVVVWESDRSRVEYSRTK